MKLPGRILLAFSAVLLVIGASIHTAAFRKASAAVATSDLAAFFGEGLKVLWLQDSTVAMVLAIVFATAAIWPFAASKAVIVLLGPVPTVTAALVYLFIGNFIGGHIFSYSRPRRNLGRTFVAGGDETVKQRFRAACIPSEAGVCNFFSSGWLRKL